MPKKIMVVDDEPDAVEVLSIRLSDNGYDVIKAYNGNEALRLARSERPDLILMDILMPGLDGAKVAEMLKDMPETKNIPVIFVTCLFTKKEEKSEPVRGGTFFIAKPYDPSQLLNVIREYTR